MANVMRNFAFCNVATLLRWVAILGKEFPSREDKKSHCRLNFSGACLPLLFQHKDSIERNEMFKILLWFGMSILVVGCAAPTPVAIKSSLNDFVANGVRTNSKDTIEYSFSSDLKDTVYMPYGKDKTKSQDNFAGNIIPERSSFEKMSKNYFEVKFSNIQSPSPKKIAIKLDDFYFEQFNTNTGGQVAAAALVGGELTNVIRVYLKSKVTITNDSATNSKVISSSAEENYIVGIGTGTSTSNIYKGENGPDFKLAKAVDDANNKAIMFIGKYLEEQGF